jgi:tetratricopeptide (TPR) repeat protein
MLALARRVAARFRSRRSAGILAAVLVALGAAGYFGGRQVWAAYHLDEARAALDRSRPRDASAHLERVLRVCPDSPEALRLAARAARQSGDLEAARDHLQLAQRLEDPPSDETVLEWSMLQAEAGELGKVEAFLRAKVAAGHPESRFISEALARGYLGALRLHETLAAVREWVKLAPDDPAAYSTRARLWVQVKVFGRAAEDFAEAVRLDPERDPDRHGLALSLIEVNRHAEAIPHLERLRAKKPYAPDLDVYLALALARVGRSAEAVQLLDHALAADPNNVVALTGHARVDLESGRDADAEHYAKRVLAKRPRDRSAVHVLYQALVGQGREDEAKAVKGRLMELDDLLVRQYDLANRLIPQRPDDPELQYQLGEVFLNLGDTVQAESWWLTVVRRNPSFTKAHQALTKLYEATGQPEKAVEHRRLATSS